MATREDKGARVTRPLGPGEREKTHVEYAGAYFTPRDREHGTKGNNYDQTKVRSGRVLSFFFLLLFFPPFLSS